MIYFVVCGIIQMNDVTTNAAGNNSQAGSASAGSDKELLDATCVTPERDRDWDKLSCSSLSEVSVACLQDRIMQMEETHYRYVTGDYQGCWDKVLT